MIKAGSILAIIGSLVGLISSLSAFSAGEALERMGVDKLELVLSIAAIGIVMNLCCLIMGVACFFEPKRIYGITMIGFGIIGVIAGGTVYATAMFLVLFGGVFITKASRKVKVA